MKKALTSQRQNSVVSMARIIPVTEVEFRESILGSETGALEKRIVDVEKEPALIWTIPSMSRPYRCWR